MVVLVLLYLMWALLVEVVLWWVAQLQKDIFNNVAFITIIWPLLIILIKFNTQKKFNSCSANLEVVQ